MGKIRKLKQQVNETMGAVIGEVFLAKQANPELEKSGKADEIIDEVIKSFDSLIQKINQKNITEKKKHFNAIKKELQETSSTLRDKIEI